MLEMTVQSLNPTSEGINLRFLHAHLGINSPIFQRVYGLCALNIILLTSYPQSSGFNIPIKIQINWRDPDRMCRKSDGITRPIKADCDSCFKSRPFNYISWANQVVFSLDIQVAVKSRCQLFPWQFVQTKASAKKAVNLRCVSGDRTR